ncbi:hypothetical protein LXL04_032657 [Taraxacum kok-saghyz]
MVFRWRCFSFKYDYETRTQTKSTTSETFYTAPSVFNRSLSVLNAKTSEFSSSTSKSSNLRVFTISELKAATRNFSRSRNIGEGGFGSVYRGVIKSLEHPFDEIQVAVKFAKERGQASSDITVLICKQFNNPVMLQQGTKEWLAEVNVLGVVEHQNLVKLVGYCEGDNERLFLVYEYMRNGSVRDILSTRSKTPLPWAMRLKVAQDCARGLTYLHEEMDFQIILRDFKTSNILLDDQWNAKLSDFGTARLGPEEGHSSILTSFVGTAMYAAPEYLATGRPHDKSWPLGQRNLITWAIPYSHSKRIHRIIDLRIVELEGMYKKETMNSAWKLANIANMCLSVEGRSRPKMSEVLELITFSFEK